MRFEELALTSAAVATLRARSGKIARLAALLSALPPDEIEPAVAFLSGTTPLGRVGVGHATVRSAADVAPAAESSLTIGEVARELARLAAITGSGAAAERRRLLAGLFARVTRPGQEFLHRLLLGELRQGALAGVLADAIAQAAGLDGDVVRRAAMLQGDLPVVARLALTGGADALRASVIQLMRPIQPMLAASSESVTDALGSLADPVFEYKLDGARIQIHKAGDEVRIFSRTLNDVTESAPEVVGLVRALPARELVLDGEVIALTADGRPMPFQATMRRFGRTRDVERMRDQLPLTPFLFDALLVDGQSLVDAPLEERARVLAGVARELIVPRIVRPDAAAAEGFAAEALARGHEGVMAKDLTSTYAAGRRGSAWRKVKQARTLDLVVLAAEWGSGRRQGWLSNLHLGARDVERGSFVMLGKTFKGMTDRMLAWQTERLQSLEIARDAWTVHVRPELVVEVAFNEIQQSPVYPAGLALRFARVKRYRTDKTAADADTIETVRRLAGINT